MKLNQIYRTFLMKNDNKDRFDLVYQYIACISLGFLFIILLYAFIVTVPYPDKENYFQNMVLTMFFMLICLIFPSIIIYNNRRAHKLKKIKISNEFSLEHIIAKIKSDSKLGVYDHLTEEIASHKCFLFFVNNGVLFSPNFQIYVICDKVNHVICYTIHLYPAYTFIFRWAGLFYYFYFLIVKKRFVKLIRGNF